MAPHDNPDDTSTGVSRRRFVEAAGASGLAVGVAGCITSNGGDGGGGSGEKLSLEPPSNKITVKWAADSRAKQQAKVYKEALRNAGLHENIELEILGGSQVTDNRQSKYQQWLSGGRKEPTLLMMDSGWTIPFIARNQILNLTKKLPEELTSPVRQDYFQASVNTAKGTNGDLFGIPLFPDFPTMQYRKDLVEEAGYDPEGEGWATNALSWERFSKVTKDVKEQTGTKYGYSFQASAYEGLSCCDFNEFMSSYGGAYFGGELFGPVGERPVTVDEQPVIDSIKMVRTLINGTGDEHSLSGITGNIAPDAVLQWTEEPSRKPFTAGNVVMHRNWPYSIVINGAEKEFGTDLGVMPIPYGVKPSNAKYDGRGGPVAALGGWHMTMNPNAPREKLNAGAQVIQAMMKESFKLRIFEDVGWIPPEPALLDTKKAKQTPVIGRYLDTLKVAGENAIPRPVTVAWPQESDKIAQTVNNSFAQKVAPTDAMNQLKKDLKSIEKNLA